MQLVPRLRMTRICAGSTAVILVALVFASTATAGGIGAYFEYSRGDQEIQFKLVEASFTNNRMGLGVVIDTNVARNELLNVRATVGYVRTENTVDDEAHGAAFDMAVGFGLFRAPAVRVWAGPAFRTSVDFYDGALAEVLDVSVGGGARLGLNWHLNPQISVSPSISYQYLYVRETIKDDFGKDEFNGHEQLITARLTFLYRDAADFF